MGLVDTLHLPSGQSGKSLHPRQHTPIFAPHDVLPGISEPYKTGRGALLALEIGTEPRENSPRSGLPTASAEWNQETVNRVGSQVRLVFGFGAVAPIRAHQPTALCCSR
jgi:hypothetical protein